jgi:PKD repeat protein
MMSTQRFLVRGRLPLLAAMAVLLSGCSVQEQRLPGLAGPSELGLGMAISATPEILPRDGSSISTITVKTFDSNGKPLANQRLIMEANAGVLSASEVVTNTSGVATLTFLAPGLNENVAVASIFATPVQNTHYQNANSRIVQIALMGPFVPDESFTFSPEEEIVPYSFVDFDALTPEEGKVRCGAACTYAWDFGDGNTASGQGARHQYTGPGLFKVTLTVTTASGTFGTAIKFVPVGMPDPPVADFSPNPASPTAPANVFFNASASTVGAGADIVQYVWNFGDGSPSATTTIPGVAHAYPVAGQYSVSMYIVDSLGRRSTAKVVPLTVQ